MKQKHTTTLVAIVILVIWGLIFGFPESEENNQTNSTSTNSVSKQSAKKNTITTNTSVNTGDDRKLIDSFTQQRSKVWMEVDMEVTRLLPDDNEGSRHQKFIAESRSSHSVLVSHNIDLADRVPVSRGDIITLRGRYEWTDRGGVLHWTHHDPSGKKEGGWIKLDGQTYR